MRWRFFLFSCSRYPPLLLFVGFERTYSEMASMVGRAGGFRILGLRQPFPHCRRLLASVPRSSSLQPPDIPALADAARISLSQKEVANSHITSSISDPCSTSNPNDNIFGDKLKILSILLVRVSFRWRISHPRSVK
ncbi:hypothetical protein KSP40_PGU007405 [Platanthera guangdongensis]|uniref:Uncharacterized protein n=1 Tax=Platanthera guangdongensis TaxID=2320717 RepID=A0ABR2LYH1_9ASPA